MLPGEYEDREGQEGEIIKVYEEPVGMMDMFVILILVMVSWVYTNVRACQILYLNTCSLLYGNHISMKLLTFKIDLNWIKLKVQFISYISHISSF